MNVVAFLQCQWVKEKSLPTIERMYRDHGQTPEGRARINSRLLFYKSATGRNLKSVFGEGVVDIIWEEASPKIATESRGVFPPDLEHIRAVLRHFKPEIILPFGRVAYEGVQEALVGIAVTPLVFPSPHPTARGKSVMLSLRETAHRLKVARERK